MFQMMNLSVGVVCFIFKHKRHRWWSWWKSSSWASSFLLFMLILFLSTLFFFCILLIISCLSLRSILPTDEPSFSLSREPGFGNPIMEGMSVSLKCEIDANPWSPPKWIKDGGTGGGEFSLNSLPSASQSSAGGSSASSLSSSGGVNQSKNSYSSQSLSPEEIKSLRNQSSGPASLTSSSKLLRSSLFESETGVITIPSAKISDTGWYRCTTDHEFGHFTSNAYYLNIRCK